MPEENTEIVAVKDDESAFVYGDWSVSLQREPTFEEWQLATQSFITVWRRSLAVIGDLLNIGERLFGDAYVQVFSLDLDDYARQSLYNAKYVCSRVKPSTRQMAPSFSHCAEVASLPENEQKKYLQMAANDDMTKQELRDRIAADRGRVLPQHYQCEAELSCSGREICLAPDPETEKGSVPTGRVRVTIKPA